MDACSEPVPAGEGEDLVHLPEALVRAAAEAAVVMARLRADADPSVAPPRVMRPFLRFTRLPDRAVEVVRRVLDDDPELRQLVRDSTSEELVGRSSWLFLDRPAGWEDELAALAVAARAEQGEAGQRQAESAASKRLAGAEDARRRAEAVAERLRAEISEARGQLVAERRSRHLAETEAGRVRRRATEVESDLERLRATVAGLEAVLEARRSDEQGAAGGQSAPQPEAPAAEDASSSVDRAQLGAALGAAVEASARLDAALADLSRSLAPLLDADGEAETTRRTLAGSPTVPSRRPLPLPPAVLDDSVEAAEHLLRRERVLVLVDGYNVTKLARPELGLAEQRRWLVDAAVESSTRTGARFEIVFDGAGDRGSAPADLGRRAGVQVRFSPAGVEADDVVLARASGLATVPLVVASDDRRVQDGARRLGVNVVGARQLLAAMKRPIGR